MIVNSSILEKQRNGYRRVIEIQLICDNRIEKYVPRGGNNITFHVEQTPILIKISRKKNSTETKEILVCLS